MADGPLPPPPLLTAQDLGLLGLSQGLASLLGGLWNPPKGYTVPNNPLPGELVETGSRALDMGAGIRVKITIPGVQTYLGPLQECAPSTAYAGSTMQYDVNGATGGRVNISGSNACGNVSWDFGVMFKNGFYWGLGSGVTTGGSSFTGPWLFELTGLSGNYEPIPFTGDEYFPEPRPPMPPFPEEAPLYEPEPDVSPFPDQPPAPNRPPFAPPFVPPSPGPDPLAPPAPGPGEQPAPWSPSPGQAPGPQPLPVPFPYPTPPPLPNPVPLPGTGTPPAPAPLPPPKPVPPSIETIGDLVIGQPGTAPPPTLEGIAQEVGKIEQKTRYLIEKSQANPPGEVIDSLDDLLDLITNVYNFLTSVYGPGGYELVSPCEEGVVKSADWSGGIGSMSLLGKKIDAIAELIQHHKDLRQPICRGALQGAPVTVNFREV
jgi:hypothetical protein